MSSSVTCSPRVAKRSLAAASRRWRLRSASARSGTSTESILESGDNVSVCGTLTGDLLSTPRKVLPMSRDPHHDRRWLILAVIGIAELLVVLDVTIVNIALPSAQRKLGFSDDQRQWVITAYALAFGSLLLLGGRIADLFGRKWTFIAGLIGFAGASALGGAAQSFSLLVGARALQGAFAAMLAPAALSLLATIFTDPKERGKAFGVYGAIGLLLGGFLTEVLDWRWCLYVSILFAVPAAIGGTRLLHHLPAPSRPRLDVPGTL